MTRILQMKNRTEARMILTRIPVHRWTSPKVMETWIEDNLEHAKQLRSVQDLPAHDFKLSRSDFMQTASEILCIANCYGHDTTDLEKLDYLCRTALCLYMKSNSVVDSPVPHEICLHLTEAAVISGLWDCNYGSKMLTELSLPSSLKLTVLESWIASGNIASRTAQVEALCKLEDSVKIITLSSKFFTEELGKVGENILQLINAAKALF